MSPLEALADAIQTFEGWHAGSRSWLNRNPGNLRAYASGQAVDKQGYRIFVSLAEGWQALLYDLKAKFHGSHGLTPETLGRAPTIADLMNVYAPAGDSNNPRAYANFVASWTSRALGYTVLPTTTLEDFVIDPNLRNANSGVFGGPTEKS